MPQCYTFPLTLTLCMWVDVCIQFPYTHVYIQTYATCPSPSPSLLLPLHWPPPEPRCRMHSTRSRWTNMTGTNKIIAIVARKRKRPPRRYACAFLRPLLTPVEMQGTEGEWKRGRECMCGCVWQLCVWAHVDWVKVCKLRQRYRLEGGYVTG